MPGAAEEVERRGEFGAAAAVRRGERAGCCCCCCCCAEVVACRGLREKSARGLLGGGGAPEGPSLGLRWALARGLLLPCCPPPLAAPLPPPCARPALSCCALQCL